MVTLGSSSTATWWRWVVAPVVDIQVTEWVNVMKTSLMEIKQRRGHCQVTGMILRKIQYLIILIFYQFSAPQIEYPLGDSSKKGSHVYFLLIISMVLLLLRQHLYQTIVQFDKTVLPRKLTTVNIHDHILCYCLLVGILFEVLRIAFYYKHSE